MEKAIDRSSYRRNKIENDEYNDLKVEMIRKKLKIFLYKILVCSIILLCVSIVKMYELEPAYSWICENINKKCDILSIYNYGQNKIVEVKNFVEKIVSEENIEKVANIKENVEDLLIEEISTPIYEEAVEGVNQLIDDAEYIKENYNLEHPIKGTITSIFGVRESENPIVTSYHSGIDVAANAGTNICAAIGGKVITAEKINSYGNYIMIETNNELVTLYAHCSELKVKKGQEVKQGQIIGKVGSTGWATGPHLHFEIRRDGRLVNPINVLDYSSFDRS